MNISRISAVFFSPTDTTKDIISTMVGKLPISTNMLNITSKIQNDTNREFSADELVIFGVPVYGGRVPTVAVEKIQNIHGRQTPAVIVVTYGNRAYDDALLELKTLVEENGFVVVAAAAFVAEHSIMHSVAHGRPDTEDNEAICDFTEKLWDKIQSIDGAVNIVISVPGHTPYREYGGVPFKPETTDACTGCGVCVPNCPVGAISVDEPNKTNEDICISCLRCIKVCPSQARKLNEQILFRAEQAFAQKYNVRMEPEIFIYTPSAFEEKRTYSSGAFSS